MSSQVRNRSALLALFVMGSLVSPIGVSSAIASTHSFIDTTDRSAVVASYDAEFSRTTPPIQWSGSNPECNAGTTSDEFREAIFARVNWYRAMGGVPAEVTEDPLKSAAAQEAALMMARTGTLSHIPDPSFVCFTSSGAAIAGESNLALGFNGPAAIDGYMLDPGLENSSVGHRNWILHPPTRTMGSGDVPAAAGVASNALYVFDNLFGPQPELRESAGFVAWPPRGYIPGEVVYPRWSFSLRGADMSGAQVTVSQGGTTLTTTVVHRSEACSQCGSAPFPVVVFEPQGVNTSPALDTTYTVSVSGIAVNGVAQSHSYTVAILGDAGSPSSGNCRQSPVDPIFSVGDPVRASVYRLYCAYFLRYPDLGGFDYWYGVQRNGASYKTISDSFELSQEFMNRYGQLTNVAFLNLVYENVLERTPDQAGHDYWFQLLSTAQISRGDMMLYFSDGQEFKNKTGTN